MTGLKSCVLWLLSLQRSRGQGSAVLGGGGGGGGRSSHGGLFDYRLQEKRMESSLNYRPVLGKALREICFLSPTWEHPLDIHVGPEAATPPNTHAHTPPNAPSPTSPASLPLFPCSARRLHYSMHTSCLTTDAMFKHGRQRTAPPASPLQTSRRLPLGLSLQLLPHMGSRTHSPDCPSDLYTVGCGLCDGVGGGL